MGIAVSSLLSRFFGKEDVRVLMVGLDNAGKTTILYKLKIGEVISTIPTIGFNVETVEYKNISFTVWDIGGQDRIRGLWYHYYRCTTAVIFVVDASDVNRLPLAAKELQDLMAHIEMENTVLLVLANKQDLPNALTMSELARKIDLHSIKQDWHVQATCATNGDGLHEGLDYLRQMVCTKRRKR